MKNLVKLFNKNYTSSEFHLYEDLGNGNYKHLGNYWDQMGWFRSKTHEIERLDILCTNGLYHYERVPDSEIDELLMDML